MRPPNKSLDSVHKKLKPWE